MSANKLKNLMLHLRTKLEQMDKLILRLPASHHTEDIRESILGLDAYVALFMASPILALIESFNETAYPLLEIRPDGHAS